MPIKTLFVTAFPYFPIDRSGGGIRSRLLLDALSQAGPVGVFYLNYRGPTHDLSQLAGSPLGDDIRNIKILDSVLVGGGNGITAYADKTSRALSFIFGSGMATAGLSVSREASRGISELIERNEVDLIVGRLSRPTAVAGLLNERRIPLIVDADDWDPHRITARIHATPKYNFPLRAYLYRYRHGSDYLGARVLEGAEHVWLASETDTLMIDRPSVTTLPNLPLARTGEEIVSLPRSKAASTVVFAVGQWVKPQNSDGMKWFLRYVWPAISQRVPQAELRIGGEVPESLARNWGAQHKVRVLGFIDELRREYDEAALIVTPITWGGGTKIKVLEAFAYGRVPIGPEHAFDGLADAPQVKAIAAIENDARRLAAVAVGLLDKPEQRFWREGAAVEYYRKNYSRAAFNAHVQTTVESAMQRPRQKLKA